MNLVGIEPELRHGRVTGLNAFGERLGECFDRITLVKRPEWRRYLERALRHSVDRMAACAIVEREGFAALF